MNDNNIYASMRACDDDKIVIQVEYIYCEPFGIFVRARTRNI